MTATFESALRRDRAIVVTGLGALVAVAWLHLVQMARDMAQMEGHAAMGMVMPQMQPWSRAELLYLFVMWSVMMVAMMTPSATPMILMFSAMNRRRAERRGPVVRTGLFVLGYLIAWIGYSAGAAVAQWVLHGRAALSPAMVSTSPYLGGGLLVAAGIFQWTPLKRACLTACRSPMGFLMTEWREGGAGALIMGVRYGVFCIGCCWVLMALLFVAGVMNLLWVAAIAAFVLIEKVVPAGERVGQAAGVILALAGVAMMVRG